jgi:hypothetical protein
MFVNLNKQQIQQTPKQTLLIHARLWLEEEEETGG